MWTRRIDRALDLPELGELYPAGSREREAIGKAVAAVEQARHVVFKDPRAPR